MPEKDIIQKISGVQSKQSVLYDKERLKTLLMRMKQLNKQMLKKYELTDIWHKVNVSLIKHNIQTSLQNVVEFKVCQANKAQKSFFNPFSKKPITMCYNKFFRQEEFEKVLSYNMILYYDSKINKNMNWNELKDVILSNVRALHISKTCLQNDRKCIKQELEKRVFQKERFRGKTVENLSQLILEGLQNQIPMSQTF